MLSDSGIEFIIEERIWNNYIGKWLVDKYREVEYEII